MWGGSLLSLAASGYILFFFSEHLFWTQANPDTSWLEYAVTWFAYTLLTFVLLTLIRRFRARTVWALFLCGAVYGWLAEGVLAQTLYESLPLSVSWTGLAWHALLSVLVGLYAIPRALETGNRRTALMASCLGLFYGLWAVAWWSEPGSAVQPPLVFAQFALTTSLPLVFAYRLAQDWKRGTPPNRSAEISVYALLLLYFVLTLPAVSVAALILPGLLGLVLLVLQRNCNAELEAPLVSTPVPFVRYLWLLLVPATAVALYSAAYALDMRAPINILVYLLLTPLGFILLLLSFWRVWRRGGSR